MTLQQGASCVAPWNTTPGASSHRGAFHCPCSWASIDEWYWGWYQTSYLKRNIPGLSKVEARVWFLVKTHTLGVGVDWTIMGIKVIWGQKFKKVILAYMVRLMHKFFRLFQKFAEMQKPPAQSTGFKLFRSFPPKLFNLMSLLWEKFIVSPTT